MRYKVYFQLHFGAVYDKEGNYGKLAVNAEACLSCGHCTARCPFRVDRQTRIHTIAEYFK